MSATTKLPTPSGSVGTWGAELNDFLTQSMVGTTTGDVTNGLLKADHAAITTGGKVGIGTSTPTAILEAKGNVKLTGSATGSLFNDGTTENTFIRGGLTTSNVNINDGSTGNTIINANGGKVGIGTSTPVSVLDINSGVTNIAANTYSLDITAVGTIGGWARQMRVCNVNAGANNTPAANFGAYGAGAITEYAYMSITTGTEDAYNSTKSLVVTKDGNVGIGTGPASLFSKFTIASLPTFANDADAGSGGLNTGGVYKTATGELRIKL